MQNPGTGPHSYSKENSQYETVARDRREQKQSPKLQREVCRWLLRLMERIGPPLDRGLNSFKKESIISSSVALCCGNSIQYRVLCGSHVSSEHESCAKSSVERFRYFVFAHHCLGRRPSRSVRNAPLAVSACVAALNPPTFVTNPWGIPIQMSSLASTPAATAFST
jgi:hypothetical protein